MAVVVETLGKLGTYVPEKQTTSPAYFTGTFTINDSDDHDFKVDGRGKSKMGVFVENPGDQALTLQVYGMHAIGSTVGGVGVKQIGANVTVGTSDNEYVTVADPFPFYLVRVTPAGAATGNPTCTVYINFHSGS